MKQSKLSNFLQITGNGNIILPIDKYEFELSPKAAENMAVALRGALFRLAKRGKSDLLSVPHGQSCACDKCKYKAVYDFKPASR